MILILSNKWDITVDFVVRELKRRDAEFLRINTEDLTKDGVAFYFPGPRLMVTRDGKAFDLSSCITAIWCRRPGKPFDFLPKEENPSEAIQKFVSDQWYACLEALELIDGARWINPPAENDRMESKLRQLRLATELGFSIPRTLVSNSGNEIRAFCHSENDRIVAKALYAPLIEEPDQDFFIFSNVVTQKNLNDDDALSVAPSIFQQVLSPKIDYRVTVVGSSVFPVRVVSNTGGDEALDWRTRESELRFEICKLPQHIEGLCRDYVAKAGLIFGALDLVEYSGEFYFLEINPNGEWGWLEKTVGVKISSAICDILLGEQES
ncbi:hypothetical protein [Sulfuritalea sp.]|uniref:hypothetical protein n=1 Tax=Sulfuritalea sp. TaxID=2480090 RepID=UPI001AC1B11B|nr:hypothetical protein [Sulfuritalea sp.]MBN8473617.1 hypothetical protein [Sulfuritalea sp.]